MDDPALQRYAALVRRVQALLGEPQAQSIAAPEAVRALLAAGAYRLGLYVSAMPGGEPPSLRDLQELAAQAEALRGDQDPRIPSEREPERRADTPS